MSFITANDGQFLYFDTQLNRPTWTGKTVLDFGGNVGNILHHPNSTIDHNKYWCFDVSRDAVEAGMKAAPEAHFVFYDRHNYEYNPNGIRELRIPETESKFDFILGLSIFTHTTKDEMIEIVSHLEQRLNDGGRLAFTFFDPHYIPPNSDKCNLKYYLEQRTTGLSAQKIEALMKNAIGAQWCTIANGRLELENDGLPGFQDQDAGYLTFYTPVYLNRIFPQAKIVEPVDPFPRQHCCIIDEHPVQ